MHVDGHLDHVLERGDELPCRLRAEQPRRVLDHDLVAAHVHQAFRKRAPQLDVVRGRDRIAERSLHLLLRLEGRRDRGLHVAEVVERIKDAEHVDARFGGVPDEQLDRIIREVAFRDEVLAPDQRLYRRVGCGLVELAQEVPRVLVDEQLRLERRAAESLHRREADGVLLGCDRNDLVGPEIAAEQRLLRVAEGGVDQPNACLLLGQRYAVASAERFSPWRRSTSGSCSPMIRAASHAAFLAPASPMATDQVVELAQQLYARQREPDPSVAHLLADGIAPAEQRVVALGRDQQHSPHEHEQQEDLDAVPEGDRQPGRHVFGPGPRPRGAGPLHHTPRIAMRRAHLQLVRQTEVFKDFDARLHERKVRLRAEDDSDHWLQPKPPPQQCPT